MDSENGVAAHIAASRAKLDFNRDSNALKRRIGRFRKAGMLDRPPELVIQQAITAEDLSQAYTLVHDVFVAQGYITPQPGGMRIRPFEALPEMVTFVAKAGDRVVAVMSVVPDSDDLGLPSDQAFAAELNTLRSQGRRLAEVTNLALDPAYRNSGVFFELSRACAALSLNGGMDDLFISISPGHSIFFETMLGFVSCGDRRNYGYGIEDRVEGMRLDLRQFEDKILAMDKLLGAESFLHDWFFDGNPYYEILRESAHHARRSFVAAELLRELFVTRTEYLQRCPRTVVTALWKRWSSDILSQVLPREPFPAAGPFRELIVA